MSGGSPAARGRDNKGRRCGATEVRLACRLSGNGRGDWATFPTVLFLRGTGVVGGGWAGAGMWGKRGCASLSSEPYIARLSGGVPGFFVPLLSGFFYSRKMSGL